MGRKKRNVFEKQEITTHINKEKPTEEMQKEIDKELDELLGNKNENIQEELECLKTEIEITHPKNDNEFSEEEKINIVNNVINNLINNNEVPEKVIDEDYYDDENLIPAKTAYPEIVPKIIIENINPELEAKYATNGSMAIDLITREEIEIPCNNYFKQSENILHFLFHKIKDIYEGNMKAEKDWHIIDKEIKALNTQYNKYHQTMIPMNIKVKYPEGYGALLIPRGSTFKKYGLLQSNSIGLIDTDFCSEHWLPVINLTNKNVTIPKGVRIAQLVFIKKEVLEIVNGIVEQHDLHNGNGSTGI